MTMISQAFSGALVNVVLLVVIPVLGYALLQRWRHRRSLAESLRRVGLTIPARRDVAIAAPIALGVAAIAAATVVMVPLTTFVHPKSPLRPFTEPHPVGITLTLALLYGVVQTGFAEEVFFRGLIGGAFMRWLRPWAANVLQMIVFLLPHLLIVFITPSLWPVALLFPGVLGLVAGWLRIRSGSIVGPWMLHGVANTTTALAVAMHAAGR